MEKNKRKKVKFKACLLLTSSIGTLYPGNPSPRVFDPFLLLATPTSRTHKGVLPNPGGKQEGVQVPVLHEGQDDHGDRETAFGPAPEADPWEQGRVRSGSERSKGSSGVRMSPSL